MPATRRKRPSFKDKKTGKGRKTQRRRGRGGAKKFMNVATAADIPAFEKMLKNGPIVVGMFYLSWCGHCKKAEPSFKDVAAKKYPGVSFAMVNSDLKDKTSLRSVEVNGVPDFFVSVPNKGGSQPNSTIKPEMSYDKPSIERLATVASNAASLGADPTTLRESLNNKQGPPPFLAINAPSVKSNSLNVKPPSFRNLGNSSSNRGDISLATSGLSNNFNNKSVKTVEEPINAVSEESTDEEEEDELMVPSYESSINARESINAGKKIKAAFSVAGEEPTAATTLSITSPVTAVSSITNSLPASTLKAKTSLAETSLAETSLAETSLAETSLEEKEKAAQTLREKEIAEGRNFSMIGGRRQLTLQTDEIPVTILTENGSKHAYMIKKKYATGEKGKYVYKVKFTKIGENGKKKVISKVEGKSQEDLINKIRELIAAGYTETL
jgi:thiol-disulfide isomerase/thioredoxin